MIFLYRVLPVKAKSPLASLEDDNKQHYKRTEIASLREQAAGQLRDYIITGSLRPGTKLVEREVANALGISRVPVREALQQLEEEGLVISRSNARYVIQLTGGNVGELTQVRLVLEKLAVELAARNTSPQDHAVLLTKVEEMRQAFARRDLRALIKNDLETHRLIWTQSRNPYLIKALNSVVSPIFTTFMAIDVERYRWGIEEVLESHENLVTAIRAGDAPLAVERIEGHILNSLRVHLSEASGQV